MWPVPGGAPPYGYHEPRLTADGKALRALRWLPDGRKPGAPDGNPVRILASHETVKKARSDIVRYVPGQPERVAAVRRMFQMCIDGYGYRHSAVARRSPAPPFRP